MPFLERALHPSAEHPDINTLPNPRILKTHLPHNIIPKSATEDSKCKYILFTLHAIQKMWQYDILNSRRAWKDIRERYPGD